jgi:diphthamide synthase subunit DPH2
MVSSLIGKENRSIFKQVIKCQEQENQELYLFIVLKMTVMTLENQLIRLETCLVFSKIDIE